MPCKDYNDGKEELKRFLALTFAGNALFAKRLDECGLSAETEPMRILCVLGTRYPDHNDKMREFFDSSYIIENFHLLYNEHKERDLKRIRATSTDFASMAVQVIDENKRSGRVPNKYIYSIMEICKAMLILLVDEDFRHHLDADTIDEVKETAVGLMACDSWKGLLSETVRKGTERYLSQIIAYGEEDEGDHM